MLHPLRCVPILFLLGLTGCFQMAVTGDVGYTSMAIRGDMALSPTGGAVGPTIDQDIESGLGLGDQSGSPYLRAELDLGVPVLSVSALQFSDSGIGMLNGSFGNISGGTQVATDLDFRNVKGALTFDIDLGPAKISPGVAVDLFDIDLHVQDIAGFAEEDVSLMAPVPLLFARAEADLGIVAGVVELGGIKVPKIQDIKGTFWDGEARVEVRPFAKIKPTSVWSMFHLFAGYRFMHLDGHGNIDNQDFDTSLDISGWLIGGGIRF